MRSKDLLCAAVFCVLAACAPKAKLDTPAPVQDKGIPGPNIQGQWISDCEPSGSGSGYRVLDVTYGAEDVSRKAHSYHDNQCQHLAKTDVQAGTYKFIESHRDGSYTMEYRIPVGNGWSALPKEKVLLENDTLYLSDFVIGDISKSIMIPLKKKVVRP